MYIQKIYFHNHVAIVKRDKIIEWVKNRGEEWMQIKKAQTYIALENLIQLN